MTYQVVVVVVVGRGGGGSSARPSVTERDLFRVSNRNANICACATDRDIHVHRLAGGETT